MFGGIRPIVAAALFVGGLIASFTVGQVTAQRAPNPSEDTASPVVRKTILPDGSIELERADGTKQISYPVQSAQPGQAASDQTAHEPINEGDLIPVSSPSWLSDGATNSAFLKAMRDYYGYKSSGLQHRSRVFEWQLFSSKVIFLVVLVLVSVGIVFAAIQFRIGLKRKKSEAPDAATEIDISPAGIKMSSTVLGVIILVISLAFFYLYLVYVYPISEII